jgi:prepilin-type N-terminal cleavage/methylation domain-containing protein
MRRRGFTLLEVLIAAVVFGLVLGAVLFGYDALTRQSQRAAVALDQMQEALLLLENVRMELSSLVMNPLASDKDHLGNSFVISKPYGSSIQFVVERAEGAARRRYLVYYEARNAKPGDPVGRLVLKKYVWKFANMQQWTQKITFPAGWPKEWIGELVEEQEARLGALDLYDMRWQYQVPDEGEGRVFLRLKLILKTAGAQLLPMTTLVSIPTPDRPTTISGCPGFFAPCYDPVKRNCFCSGGGK